MLMTEIICRISYSCCRVPFEIVADDYLINLRGFVLPLWHLRQCSRIKV